jgi:hypothetical protein
VADQARRSDPGTKQQNALVNRTAVSGGPASTCAVSHSRASECPMAGTEVGIDRASESASRAATRGPAGTPLTKLTPVKVAGEREP